MSLIGLLGRGFGSTSSSGGSSSSATLGTILQVTAGDDYSQSFSNVTWPDLTGAAVAISAFNRITLERDLDEIAVTVVDPDQIQIDLTSEQTRDLTPGANYRYDVQAILEGGEIATLMLGRLVVSGDVTPP